MKRCDWVKTDEEKTYHDLEWGKISHDDRYLFEMLILEGMQAGLSWITILKKRKNYERAFHNFDVDKVADMSDKELESLLHTPDAKIIRNRNKVFSIRTNARAFKCIQKSNGSFYAYIWSFVPNGKQIVHQLKTVEEMPTKNKLSEQISNDLKRQGFKFVGPIIIYSYLQAIGVINDHIIGCAYK